MKDILPKELDSLKAQEKRALIAYAFVNSQGLSTSNRYNKTIAAILACLSLTQNEFGSFTRKLNSKGLLMDAGYDFLTYNYKYRASDVVRIPIMEYAFTQLPDLANKLLSKMKTLGCASELCDVVKNACSAGNKKKAALFMLDHTDLYAIESAPISPIIQPILNQLCASQRKYIVLGKLERNFLLDAPCSEAEFDLLRSCTSGITADEAQNISDIIDLYTYFLNGSIDTSVPLRPNGIYRVLLYAVRKCNLGLYQEAADLFAFFLKEHNKISSVKNAIPLLMPLYYLVMTYVHLNTPAYEKKLKVLCGKKDLRNTSAFSPAYVLADAFSGDEGRPDKNMLMQMGGVSRDLNFTRWPVLPYFANMIARHFSMSLGLPFPSKKPSYEIVSHECRFSLKVPEAKMAELDKLYGSKPALDSTETKPQWELAIDSILKELNAESEKKNSPTASARIIYCISDSYYHTITPMLQTVLKSGQWSKLKSISKQKFIEGGIDGMDSTDHEVARLMIKADPYTGYPGYPDLKDVIESLVGSDRVYYAEDGLPCLKVTIDELKPELYIKRNQKSGSFDVSTNIDQYLKADQIGIMTIANVEKKNERCSHFTMLRITQRTHKLLSRLLEIKCFPLEAESKVREMLFALEDSITVKSPLTDLSEMPMVEGNDSLVIKTQPMPAQTYSLLVQAHPVDGGSLYAEPGEGKPVGISQSPDGKAVRVKRNLKAEAQALSNLTDNLESLGIVLDGTTATTSVDGMLSIVNMARESEGKIAIEWPEGKKLAVRQLNSAGTVWNVGLKSSNGWFDVEGDVRLDQDTVLSMAQLLELVASSKGRFIKLSDDDYLEISNRLRRQLERIEALAVKNRNKLQISDFNASLLDDAALDGEVKVAFDQKLADLRAKMATSMELSPKVPKKLNATLRPYQEDGYKWMMRMAEWGAGVCLADDMGLGKTVQTIAFLLQKASEGPALVVAPASVAPNWVAEIERFAPSLNPAVLNKADDRKALVKSAKKNDVIITTYGLLNTEEECLEKKKWSTICLDEAHTIKNRETKMSQAAMKLKADYRIILTGTPIQNHLGELWNLMRFINPGLLGSFDAFKHKFLNPIADDNEERRKALQRIIKPFMLRRTKKEVMDDLPDKIDIVLPIELSDKELAMYEAMRIRTAEAIESAEKVDVNTLAEITKLRRAACSIKLVDNKWDGPDSKVRAFLDLVDDFKGSDNRMLVFSQFTSYLDIVRKALDQAGEKYLYLDGSTTMKKREKLVEEFRNGDCPIFLISLKAGGLGLNLPEANYVVHLDPWWNPAIEQQATDRAYRIGQKRNVTVYHLLAKNTIEEKIRRLHRTKADLADSLLEGSGMAAQLTINDILDLISTN